MTRNIKLIIEYDGTNYCGWQEQRQHTTIQACLQQSILELTGEAVSVIGAGRTDAGVHAYGQVANFHTTSTIPAQSFSKALNSYLPSDIVIRESTEVAAEFHAQYWAKAKAYSYRIVCRPVRPAIEGRYAHWVWDHLDIASMRQGAQYLVGTHDFSSFEAADSPRKTSVRTVHWLELHEDKDKGYVQIRIEADGFLYHMVRNIVGTLLAVGRQRTPPAKVLQILEAKVRHAAGPTVPAKGLFLEYVKY